MKRTTLIFSGKQKLPVEIDLKIELKIMFRNKIQKVFVMLNEVEPPETDHIESAAETLISKQSINFNDNPSANPPSK